jgi:hypothetical protein
MRAKYLFIISGLLLVLAFGLLAAGWHGTVNVSFSWPISASAFKFAGEATGGWAIGGVLSALAAIVVFLTASVRAVLHLGADRDEVPTGSSGK